jgi:hypothetical protein
MMLPQQGMPQPMMPQPMPQQMPQQPMQGRPMLASAQPQPKVRGHSEELRPAPASPSPQQLGVALPSPEALGVALPSAEALGLAPGAAAGVDWAATQARLRALGATCPQLDVLDGGFRFTFVVPTARPGEVHRVEARAGTEAEAVRLALERAAAERR